MIAKEPGKEDVLKKLRSLAEEKIDDGTGDLGESCDEEFHGDR